MPTWRGPGQLWSVAAVAGLVVDTASGGTVASGACLVPYDGVTELTSIGVQPAWRRHGIGAVLTAALAGAALHAGSEIVYLTPAHDEGRATLRASRASFLWAGLAASRALPVTQSGGRSSPKYRNPEASSRNGIPARSSDHPSRLCCPGRSAPCRGRRPRHGGSLGSERVFPRWRACHRSERRCRAPRRNAISESGPASWEAESVRVVLTHMNAGGGYLVSGNLPSSNAHAWATEESSIVATPLVGLARLCEVVDEVRSAESLLSMAASSSPRPVRKRSNVE